MNICLNNENKPLKPFIAPGSEKLISSEEIEKRKLRIARAEKLGISLTRVSFESEEFVNPYKLQIMRLINEDKEIPEELIKKMHEVEEEHKKD